MESLAWQRKPGFLAERIGIAQPRRGWKLIECGCVKRRFRLTRSTDFQRVRQLGKSYAHPLIVLIALPNQEPGTRIGVTAGRSVGNAVQRNRAKRILRNAMQPYLPRLRTGWDIVLIARHSLIEADFQQSQNALATLIQRAKLLSNDGRT